MSQQFESSTSIPTPLIMPRPIDRPSAIVTYIALLTPMIYLCYHGWAQKHLLDTTLTDKLAFRFWLWSMIFACIALLGPML